MPMPMPMPDQAKLSGLYGLLACLLALKNNVQASKQAIMDKQASHVGWDYCMEYGVGMCGLYHWIF